MTSVGTIVSGGFALIRNHPRQIAVWALIHMALALATYGLMRWQLHSMGLIGTNGPPSPEAMVQSMAFVVPSQLLNFTIWVVGVVIACGAYRLVLRPREQGFAGLRVGMDEVRVFGVGVILFIAMMILFVVVGLIGVIVALATGLFASGGEGPSGAVVLVMGLFIIGLVLGLIFAGVRLSLALPLTFAQRRIGIDQSWSLTRGHFWTLFVSYLVIGVIVMVVGIAVALPYFAHLFSTFAEIARNPAAAQEIQQRQMATMFDISLPMMIGMSALSGISQALTAALTGGATATAARSLLDDAGIRLEGDVEADAEVFE